MRISLAFRLIGLCALAGCSSSANNDGLSAKGGSAGAGRAGSSAGAASSVAGAAGSGGTAPSAAGGGASAGAAQGGSFSSAGLGGGSGSAGSSGSGGSSGPAAGGVGNSALARDCTTLCAVWSKVPMCSLGSDCATQCEGAAQLVASTTKYQAMLDCEAKSLTTTSEYFCSGGPLIATDDGTGPAPTIHALVASACKQEICDFTCNEASNDGLYDTNVCTTDACQCSDC